MTAPLTERAEFETWCAIAFPSSPLTRHPDAPEFYDGVLASWTWLTWQAARSAAPAVDARDAAAARYEYVRKLNPRQFTELYIRNLNGQGAFDDLVDAAMSPVSQPGKEKP